MESSFISAPTNFEHMEGNSVNFKKTFDLNGTDNDEMLRLYLRKAGLSDEIEYLTPEQRRAFIYDIIKSNKMPGYWMPSTMKTSLFTQTPPAVRPPPPPASMRPSTNSPLMERRPEPPSPQYASMSTSSSTSSLQSLPRESPILPHRFAQPTGSPSGPPSPSTFVTGQKGKYEISGPMNFRHISGDMTRDMTRNAFDLSRTMNDNVLKKYLIERGIREEDISGMRKEELIKKIVQSKYTWVPPRKNSTFKPEIKYATISSNSGNTLPPPPATPTSPATSSPTPSTHSADMLSNYSIITARFADPSQFPAPDLLYSEKAKPEPPTVVLPPLPPQALRPAPPPRKSKSRRPSNETPPPPSVVTATPNNASSIYSTIRTEGDYAASTPEEGENLYSTPITTTTKPMPNKKPPSRNSCVESENNLYESIGSSNQTTSATAAPTPPPPPMPQNMGSSASPPPPPPPTKQTGVAPTNVSANTTSTEDSRDALLESIRNGVTLKKVNKKASTVGAVKPKSARKPIAIYQPPKPINARTPPPPTPPMKHTNGGGGAPPPPPMQQTNGGGGAPPPPPPPIKQSDSNTVKPITASTDNSGDSRDAFLESIRKGVALKKVDQKAATVSGARTRADRKPPVTDFLSELKMGITLRKVKLSGDNDEDEPDETDA